MRWKYVEAWVIIIIFEFNGYGLVLSSYVFHYEATFLKDDYCQRNSYLDELVLLKRVLLLLVRSMCPGTASGLQFTPYIISFCW